VELGPQSKRLLSAIEVFLKDKSANTFKRRELREATGMGDTQLKIHLAKLVDLEYVKALRAGCATSYELYDYSSDQSKSGSDQSVIGRFSSHSNTEIFNQLDSDNSKEPNQSVGIGRLTNHSDSSLNTDLVELKTEEVTNRSAISDIRDSGEILTESVIAL
jgi:hypothetical protein